MRAFEIQIKLLDEARGPMRESYIRGSVMQQPGMDDATFYTHLEHELKRLCVGLMRHDLEAQVEEGRLVRTCPRCSHREHAAHPGPCGEWIPGGSPIGNGGIHCQCLL